MSKIKVIFKDEKIFAKVNAYINKRDEIADTTATYKKEIARQENRKKFYIAKNDNINTILCNTEIERLTNIYKDTMKELNDEKSAIVDSFFYIANITENLYNAYLCKIYNCGKLSRFTYKNTNGKEIEVKATYTSIYKDFLVGIGFRGINSADDLNSIIDYIKSIIGAKICKKGTRFIVAINEKQFKELLVNSIIQYAIDGGFYMYEKGTGLIG